MVKSHLENDGERIIVEEMNAENIEWVMMFDRTLCGKIEKIGEQMRPTVWHCGRPLNSPRIRLVISRSVHPRQNLFELVLYSSLCGF